MSQTHLSDLKFRMMTIELLRTAKKHYTYRELSLRTGLPVTVLSRYVKGHVLPSSSRAKNIWDKLERVVGIEEELRRRIKFDEQGYFDNTSMVTDSLILQQATQNLFIRFAGKRITKVLTAAVDGIPLSTVVAGALGVDLVIAKRTKEVGIRDFIEETYIPGSSGVLVSLYVPRNAIKRGDSVLVVDDIIKTGETQRALINLALKARASVAGLYALIAIGNEWKNRLNFLPDCQTEVAVSIRQP